RPCAHLHPLGPPHWCGGAATRPTWPTPTPPRRPIASSAVATAAVPPAKPALAWGGGWRGKRDRHRLLADLFFDRFSLRGQLLDRRLPAQVEPALAVDLDGLDHDLVADVAHLFDALHAV